MQTQVNKKGLRGSFLKCTLIHTVSADADLLKLHLIQRPAFKAVIQCNNLLILKVKTP